MLDNENFGKLSELQVDEFVNALIDQTGSPFPQSRNYQIDKTITRYQKILGSAYKHLSSYADKQKIASSGVEWYLDNYFVILKTIELIQDDLPRQFFDKLPSLDSDQGTPRILFIAKSIIQYYQIEITSNDLNDFINIYQQEISLKMSELWALPVMLRLVLIECLFAHIFDLVQDESTHIPDDVFRFDNIKADEIIARAIRTLLLLDRINWKKFFESHSSVNQILRTDPSGIYQKMDFDTRNLYRTKIDILARKTNIDETNLAKRVIEFAEKAESNDDAITHVGYYLIDKGEEQLKKSIGYRPDFFEGLRNIFFKHNTIIYLGSISVISLIVLMGLIIVSHFLQANLWQIILIGLLGAIPASSVAVNLVNSLLTVTLPPRTLPKMDFSKRIPKDFRSVITIPALLTSLEELDFLTRQIELHYLANKDNNLGFILLTDFGDAPNEHMPEDATILKAAIKSIDSLNEKYLGDRGRKPFYLFHRRRQWNPQENSWIGWERKRGKLADLNRYLLEAYKDSFDTIVGDIEFLSNVRFVITLDADTIMPRDSGVDLIATLAHPLNQARFIPGTNKISSGYSILQPRTEVKPTSVLRSFFTKVYAGDLGLDLYTRAVSDVYQDLFGEAIYVGKGIYDVRAFHKSLEGKVPDNALLSHDLFEGIQGRAGLVSDVIFFEDYPPDYASQVNRLHRWVRGDWQLFPWLFPKVPTRSEKYNKNPFSIIDRWKIFDNLRRSLLTPSLLAVFIIGWLVFSSTAWIWTLVILTISAFPIINSIVTALSSRFLVGAKINIFANLKTALYRWILRLLFLPYEALTMIDAITTTLIRVFISRKRLLQWQTSAHTIKIFGKQRKISTIWQRMIGAPIISLALGVFILLFSPNAFWMSFPLLLFWLLSPQVAYWISLERSLSQTILLKDSEIKKLRTIARRTWLFFEHFVGPEDHWLPPDHFQENPKGMVAHRTSPTNIGLMLLSMVAAHDFGYIGILDFIYRTRYTFESLDKLEKYRGHLFNWYDTQDLHTLIPRYVSTVDSGNFAVSLIGLVQALMDLSSESVCPKTLINGFNDSLAVFCEIVDSIDDQALDKKLQSLLDQFRSAQSNLPFDAESTASQLSILSEFEKELSEPIQNIINTVLSADILLDPSVMQNLRYWSDAIFVHLDNIQKQIKILAPWIKTWENRPEWIEETSSQAINKMIKPWRGDQLLDGKLQDLPQIYHQTINYYEDFDDLENELQAGSLGKEEIETLLSWLKDFIEDIKKSRQNTLDLIDVIDNLINKINFYIERMEFGFLFDKQREVFYLGYQVDSGKMDRNHYDLLASEARTASLFAIARNEVPRSHWLHMSRPFTMIKGIPTLISWNGSMFEYLMPNLFLKTYQETLLHQTSKGSVQAQIDYGRKMKVPWGISESSYYRFDNNDNYQYKGFGVPALGRKRGLGDELVVSPYASLMAIQVDPKAVLNNVYALEKEGLLGQFGFYESIDYTEVRMPIGQSKAVIKSYMVHHHGMTLTALSNFLNHKKIVDRVHEDPRIQSSELLLQEQIPQVKINEKQKELMGSIRVKEADSVSIQPWSVVNRNEPGKNALVLSNGNLQLLVTDTGSGYLNWKETALTRWRADKVLDEWGIWFYIQDIDTSDFWSIGQQPCRNEDTKYQVIYSSHMAEFHQVVDDDLLAVMQVTISPGEDVCLHKITLTNQSPEVRHIRILSYGEVVLAPQATDRQHPAFNKLFIESEYEDKNHMLYFRRRKRASREKDLGMAHQIYSEDDGKFEYSSDRAGFIGRGLNSSSPYVLVHQEPLSEQVGITLDPIFSLGKHIKIRPNQSVVVSYLTYPADTIIKAKQIAKQFSSSLKINNAFSAAESANEKLLRSLSVDNKSLKQYQELVSHLLYPSQKLRTDLKNLKTNRLGQSALWAYGISGDYPILLVSISHKEQIEKLQELLSAHTYWRKLDLLLDLVIINTKDAGYTQELNEKIHQAINVMNSQSWVNQRGGIFVLTASQIEKNSLKLLKASANVTIDLQSQTLEEQLSKARESITHLPKFSPPGKDLVYKTDRKQKKPDNLRFSNDIGGFTEDGKEYKIYLKSFPAHEPVNGQITPMPWVNVIANEYFGFLVSESGSGYTWSYNSGENRLTPWLNDPVSDPSGECLYLRDEINGEVWSPTPLPAGAGIDYLVSHGQGYSIFESFHHGLEQSVKMFADSEDPVKIIQLNLKNLTDEPRRLTATYFAEWVLSAHRQGLEAFIVPEYDNESESLFARNTYSAEFSERVSFLTSNLPIHSMTTNREEFLGTPGDRKLPAGLLRVGLSGIVEPGVDPCAALQVHINLKPGEDAEVVFILGQGENLAEARQLASSFSDIEKINSSWKQATSFWDQYLSSVEVNTPDQAMNMMLNRWLPYQTLACRIWGRTGLFQSSGAYGYRDQLQDVMALLTSKPELCRAQILRAARHQFEDGDVLHWWHPPSGRGVRTRITDDLLWLVYVTAEYVRKTGDIDILKEEVPFRKGDELQDGEEERYGHYELTTESYSIFEHCRRAMTRGDTKGPHSLPLIGGGDWNDGMNRVGIEGKGESVWLAWFLLENHHRFAELCDLMDEQGMAKNHSDRAEQLKKTINDVAWEDDRFLRGYFDNGNPLGSKKSDECQIDSLPQSWSILVKGTSEERQNQAIRSVEKHLIQDDARIIQLFTPPFDKTDDDPGYIKGYPPGIRENGGQYTHAAIWAVWAQTEIGHGNKAYQQFSYLNPINHSLDLTASNKYGVEPYVVAADIYSQPPFRGKGGWTWYTGSSGWLYRLGIEAILGLQVSKGHFKINPCIPSEWDGFKMTFRKNGATYFIQVKNPDHIEKGIKSIDLDGKNLDELQIPYGEAGTDYKIIVLMG